MTVWTKWKCWVIGRVKISLFQSHWKQAFWTHNLAWETLFVTYHWRREEIEIYWKYQEDIMCKEETIIYDVV